MPWGDEPCEVPARFEVACDDHLILLCDECLDAWREHDRREFGEVRLRARPL